MAAIAEQEKRHAEEQGRIAAALAAAEQRFSDRSARAAADAVERLRRSEQRGIYISARPKLAPLPPETLRAMQPNSTASLARASEWSRNSERLLNSVTGN